MPLDPSIILQSGKGITALKDPSEIADEQMARQTRQLQLQQAQQGITDDQTARSIAQSTSGGDLAGAYQKAGLLKQAQAAQSFQNDQQKSQAERGKLVAEGMKNGAAMILANPTEQNAIDTLTMAQKQYGLPQEMVDGAKAKIYQARNDPNALKQLAVGWGGDAEKVLGKFTSVNMGGTQEQQRVNPVTGQMEVAGIQARTQSPDSLAGQAVTMRGQDMANQRAQEANALRAQGNAAGKIPSGYEPDPANPGQLRFIPGGPADPNTKPAGGKPLNDTQAKALQFGTRMQAAGDIFDKLAAQGVNSSVPGARAGYGIGSVISALQPAERQQLDQAKRDFINAVLRRESGAAIAPSEFDSAEKQYFPQPGDSEAVIAQKKSNRELSTRGILEEVPDSDARVKKIRGAQPNSGGATGDFEAPKGAQPKTKPVNVGGQDFMAERAPDGKYYVQKNGKWFEVR